MIFLLQTLLKSDYMHIHDDRAIRQVLPLGGFLEVLEAQAIVVEVLDAVRVDLPAFVFELLGTDQAIGGLAMTGLPSEEKNGHVEGSA